LTKKDEKIRRYYSVDITKT
jgi:hypothetical protein